MQGVEPASQSAPLNGLVLSDLHLFAGRSQGVPLLESARESLDHADVLVLNGDTFDFRWSTLGHHEKTIQSAMDQLNEWLESRPNQTIHFIEGNHDCLDDFVPHLDLLAVEHPRFFHHSTWLQLGDQLFIHGDCANKRMHLKAFDAYRAGWRRDTVRGPLQTCAYQMVDKVGLTWLTHQVYFRQAPTVQRVAYFLDHAHPPWRDAVRDVYFGHTHMPFQNVEHDGVRFHNTGSGIEGMTFNPLSFSVNERSNEL